MAKQNTSLQITSYRSDFGDLYSQLPVRFSANAPIPDNVYAERTGTCGGGGLPFSPRYLLASFDDGQYKYVVPRLTSIPTIVASLLTLGANCIDLFGEEWTTLPPSVLPDNAEAFRTTPYAATDINGNGDKETGKFTYTSGVLGAQRVGYTLESTNATLLGIQKTGMTEAVVGGLNSRPKNRIINPRKIILHAEVADGTTISRICPVSTVERIDAVIVAAAPAAFYLGYIGESTRRLQDINFTTP